MSTYLGCQHSSVPPRSSRLRTASWTSFSLHVSGRAFVWPVRVLTVVCPHPVIGSVLSNLRERTIFLALHNRRHLPFGLIVLVLGMCFFAGGIKYAEQGFGVSECRSRFVSHFSVQDAVFSVSVQDAVFFSILVQDAVFFRFRAGRSLFSIFMQGAGFSLFVQSVAIFVRAGANFPPFPPPFLIYAPVPGLASPFLGLLHLARHCVLRLSACVA